tara:strand:+ start:185 stop:607 length:423 start_codon:yes stop_codon:yes gene_type:complete
MNKGNRLRQAGYFVFGIFSVFGTLSSCQSQQELKTEQYYVEGLQIYQMNCANCHQENGEGLANLYPAITDSKLFSNEKELARLIKYGTKSNVEDHRPMPANLNLKDLEIAEVITFLKVKWGKDSVYTDTETVIKALEYQQ